MENTKDIKLQLEDLNNVLKGQKSNPVYIEVTSVLKEFINSDKLDPKQIVEKLSKYKHDYFINETVKEISAKYKIEEKVSPVSNNVTETIFEFKITDDIRTLRTSSIGKHPMVNGYLVQLEQYINNNKGVPQYRYINEFINRLTPYKYDTEVKSIVEKLETYLKENNSKLLVLDTIYNLRKQNVNNFYDSVLEKLENSVFKNDYSYSSLQLETREFKTIPVVKTLVESVAKLEGKEFKVWETKTNNVKVQNVVCPVKSEKDKTILFLEGKFLLVADKKVTELSENKVMEKLPKFYSYCKNFESIGFSNTTEGLSKQISNYITVSLKTNESGELKPFINNSEVKTIKNLNEVMVTEGLETRSKLTSLFEGIDKVGLLEEVKLINNTIEGNKIYIFKLEEKYNLFVIEKKQIKLFESTGYQTYQYVNKKFKFDISPIFENEIKTAHNTLKKLEEKKSEIIKALSIVESSIKKIDESIRLNSKDSTKVNKLEELKFDLDKEVINLKESYTKLDIESKEIANLKEEATNYTYEMGETIKLKDGQIGEIVSINDANNEYGVYTKDNKFIVAKEEDIESSIADDINPEVQMQGEINDDSDKSIETDSSLELDNIAGEENEKTTPETEETIDDVITPEEEQEEILNEDSTLDTNMEVDQTTVNEIVPIIATVIEDYGDFKVGDKVQVDPTSYTSSGDEDLVAIIKKVDSTDETPIEDVVTDTEKIENEPTETPGAPIETEVNADKELDTTTNATSITIPKRNLEVEVIL